MSHDLQTIINGLGAKREGSSWKAKCPCHEDKTGSLDITEKNGHILVKCFGGCPQDVVMAKLKEMGLWPQGTGNGTGNRSLPPGIWSSIKGTDYRLSHLYAYRDQAGNILGYVGRYDAHGRPKEIRPFFKHDGVKWKAGGPQKPKPLYGLDRLAKRADAPVIVCEGEKAADAIERLMPNYVGVTSPGGVEGATSADWTPLAGREVTIWPDNDDPGRKYAQAVVGALHHAKATVKGVVDVATLRMGQKEDAADWPQGKPIPEFLPIVEPLHTSQQTNVENVTPHLKMPSGWTAKELCSMDLPEPRWIIQGILPEGQSILAGPPKIGKSWFCLGIAVAVASGGYVLGSIHVEPGEVLYLALEDSPRRLKKRLLAVLAGSPAPEKLHIKTSWPRIDKGGVTLLHQWLEAHPETRLVIIDTLAKVSPAQKRANSESQYSKDYDFIGSIKAVADAYNISILLVHHLRKAVADDPLDRISGTVGLSGGADTIMMLDRPRGKPDATLFCTGRDIEETRLSLRFDRTTCSWIAQGAAPEIELTKEQNLAMKALVGLGGSARRADVAMALGKNPNATGKILQKLVQIGFIRQDLYGEYSLIEKDNFQGTFGTLGTPGTIGLIGTIGRVPQSALECLPSVPIQSQAQSHLRESVPLVPSTCGPDEEVF